MTSYAVVYTVKNESRLLPEAIQYFQKANCAHIYIYFDNSTDDSRLKVQHIGGVTCFDSIKPEAIENPPGWVNEITPRWQENMDVRKRINTLHAARLAQSSEIDWLASIDPDELVVPDLDENHIRSNFIEEFLESIPADVDQVLLKNLEVVPTRSHVKNPFVECRYFLNRFAYTESIWRYVKAMLKVLVPRYKFISWCEYYFYKIRFIGLPMRSLKHPDTGKQIPSAMYLGYLGYKSIIKTKVAVDSNFDIHKWLEDKKPLKILKKGYVLHFDLFDAEYMSSKFKKRGAVMMVKEFYSRYMIASIVNDCGDSSILNFFNKSICINSKTHLQQLQNQGIIKKIDSIAEFILKK